MLLARARDFFSVFRYTFVQEVDTLFGKQPNLTGGEYFEYDPTYGQLVNRHNSTVHVPIDIYDKGSALQYAAVADRLSWEGNAIGRVRLSVRLFPLFFEPTDV